ncbi:MAG TPA: DUF3418 domain-containing protein, partial [Myxococcaceae bacterium]|nr:DUF3418 domain-containing protein [Myxococcaceae bacterium]
RSRPSSTTLSGLRLSRMRKERSTKASKASGASSSRTSSAVGSRGRSSSGYLRAAQARLSRAVTNPGKDAEKAAPFTPLWESFLARRATVRDQEAAQELRWAFEELRVAIFAPEVTTPMTVTVAKVGAALAALRSLEPTPEPHGRYNASA